MRQTAVLTIGNFDGVHLGHQALLKRVTDLAAIRGIESAVLTFSNHPTVVLKPDAPVIPICTPIHKEALIKSFGIQHIYKIPFTPELSQKTAREFIQELQLEIYFPDLILGHDAVFGKGRMGDRSVIETLGRELNFHADYQPAICHDNIPVSSSAIRRCLKEGNLEKVNDLLGRKYSILQKVSKGLGLAKQLGYPTYNFDVSSLCLPPLGIYIVGLIAQGQHHPAVASLGIAPTIRNDLRPILEVHLLGNANLDPSQPMETVFYQYLRPEAKFDTLELLSSQIGKDVIAAKGYFFNTV